MGARHTVRAHNTRMPAATCPWLTDRSRHPLTRAATGTKAGSPRKNRRPE